MPTPPSPALTPAEIATLHDRAVAVARNAYAPYSKFRVGAAILLESGSDNDIPPNTIVTGCNVENASFRLTTCAEQSAIAAAVAAYGPTLRLRVVFVVNLNRAVCPPCGACRQTILEFSTPATRIFYPGPNQVTTEATIADLLPAAFQSDSFLPGI